MGTLALDIIGIDPNSPDKPLSPEDTSVATPLAVGCAYQAYPDAKVSTCTFLRQSLDPEQQTELLRNVQRISSRAKPTLTVTYGGNSFDLAELPRWVEEAPGIAPSLAATLAGELHPHVDIQYQTATLGEDDTVLPLNEAFTMASNNASTSLQPERVLADGGQAEPPANCALFSSETTSYSNPLSTIATEIATSGLSSADNDLVADARQALARRAETIIYLQEYLRNNL